MRKERVRGEEGKVRMERVRKERVKKGRVRRCYTKQSKISNLSYNF